MADNETRVIYKAIGEFSSLSRSIGTLRRNIAALRKEQAQFNAESVAGSAAAAAAQDKSTKARKAENAEASKTVSVYDAAAAALSRAAAARDEHNRKSRESAAADNAAASAAESLARSATRIENAMNRAASAFEKATAAGRRNESQNKRTASSQNQVINGAQRVLSSFQRLGSFKPDIVPPFIALIPAIAGILALINPLVAGLGAAGSAGIGFASSLGSLAGAALGAAPALAGLLSLVGALKVAFGGVGNVFKQYGAMQKAAGGGGGGGGGSKQIEITQTEKIARANETYRRSIQDVKFAEDDLNTARKDYLKRLSDLQKAVDRYAVSQARAAANTRLAQENYANVLADPGSTKGQKMDAAAGVKEAQDAQRDVVQQGKQDAADLAAMKKTGINGDRQVIQAQRAVTDAINAQRDAQIALLNAQKGTNQAAGGGASAAAAYQDALDKLSPSARSVVLQLIAMKGAWDQLQRTVQEAFFSQIVDDIQLLRKLFGPVTTLLSAFATEAGKAASNFIKLGTSDAWLKDISDFGTQGAPAVKDIGDILMYVADGFRNIVIGALPFTKNIIKDLSGIARRFRDLTDTARKSGSMASYLERVQRRLEQWGRIVTNIGKTLINFGSAASEFGDWVTTGFENVTQGWVDASRAARKEGSPFRKYLEDIKPLVSDLNGLLGDFFRWIGRTMSDPTFIKQMRDVTNIIRTKLGPALSDISKVLSETGIGTALVDTIAEIARTIQKVLDNGGAEGFATFFKILKDIVKVIGDAASLPGGGLVISGIVTALASLAAITFVGKFTGLFTLFGWLLKLSKAGGVSKILDKLKGLGGIGGRGSGSGSRGSGSGSGSGSGPSFSFDGGGSSDRPMERRRGSGGRRGVGTGPRYNIVDPGEGPQRYSRGFGRPNISSLGRGGRLGGARALGGGLLDLLGLGGLGGAGSALKGLFGRGGAVAGKAGVLGKAGAVLGGVGKAGGSLLRGFGPGAILSIGGSIAGDAISNGAAKGKSGSTQRVGGSIVSGLATGAGIGATVGGAIGSVVPVLGTGVGAAAGGAVGGAIGGASAFFSASDEDKKKFLDDVKTFFTTDVPNFFKTIGSSIWDGLTTFGQWLSDTWVAAGEFLKNLPTNLAYSVGALWANVQNFGDWLVEKWNDAVEWVQGLPQRIADTAKDVWRFIRGLPSWLREQWNNAVEWVRGLPKRIADTAGNIWDNLKKFGTWLRDKWEDGRKWVAGLPKRIGDAAGDVWSKIGDIGGWLAKQGGKVKTWAQNLAGNIGDWVGDLGAAATKGYDDNRNKGKNKRHNGGPIKRAGGGPVPGRGNSDTVPAMLTPGEFVLRRAIADRFGVDELNRFNSGVLTYAQLLQRAMQNGKETKATAGVGGIDFFNGGGPVTGYSRFGGGTSFGGGVGYAPPPATPTTKTSGGPSSGGGLTLGTINVYNPVAEKASDSIPKSIRRTASLGSLRRDSDD